VLSFPSWAVALGVGWHLGRIVFSLCLWRLLDLELCGWFCRVRSYTVSGLNLLGKGLFSESWQAETRGRRTGMQPLSRPCDLAQQAAPSREHSAVPGCSCGLWCTGGWPS